MDHLFDYKWNLSDYKFQKDKGKVFSCFSCGGGSTMGYKLAGYEVIGCNEIDSRMMDVYKTNHSPKYAFLEPIQEFKNRKDLPKELYDLDILDGSPPCSTFSIAGSRQDAWGVEKKFREGQSKQILDTLFFDFIELAERLQPKVVIGENVKGMLIGDAKKYVTKIYDAFDKAGYYCQHWLLDAKCMGVPQRRERVFFVCLRKDIASSFLNQANLFEQKPCINLDFFEPIIKFKHIADYSGREITSKAIRERWNMRKYGDTDQACLSERISGKRCGFNQQYVYMEKVCPALTGKEDSLLHFEKPNFLGKSEVCCISSFPQDYNFLNQSPHYVCGMSVPPIMMAQVATRVYTQWLEKLNTKKI